MYFCFGFYLNKSSFNEKKSCGSVNINILEVVFLRPVEFNGLFQLLLKISNIRSGIILHIFDDFRRIAEKWAILYQGQFENL